jgi:hypothetical protein
MRIRINFQPRHVSRSQVHLLNLEYTKTFHLLFYHIIRKKIYTSMVSDN